jgi:hypothetical protein
MTSNTVLVIPDDERLNILKQELTILAAKIGGTVDTLWKIRGLSLTLWTAAFTVGVGNFTTDKQPIIVILIVTAFLPLLFLFVDAKNNQWYRRLSERESQIQQFLNDPKYVLSATGLPATLQSASLEGRSLFPVYDLTGVATLGEDPTFKWQTTILRSMVDTIPSVVYWSQVFFSCIACTLYANSPVRLLFLPISIILFLVLRTGAWLCKKKLYSVDRGSALQRTHGGLDC